jgi:hypothetical protein
VKRRLIPALVIGLMALLVTPTAQAASEPSVELLSLSTSPSAAGQQVEAAFAVTGPIEKWTLRLTVGLDPLPNRSSLNSAIAPAGITVTSTGNQDLSDGERTTIIMRASVGRLALGAHPARIELLRGSRVEADESFFIATLESPAAQRTPVVWLWPITERPHRGIDGIFFDDQLALAINNGGRLARLVARGAGEPVVWVIDPALLDAVEDMSDGYRLRSGDQVVEREPSGDAQQWLSDLASATQNREVIVLPFGDPDLASLSQLRGNEIAMYQRAGVEIASRLLGRSESSLYANVAWPRAGKLSQTLLADLRRAGYSAVITSSREFANIEGATFTPTARASSVDGLAPVVADAVASTWLGRSTLVSATRVPAEIATISSERPAQARLQVLAPARGWDPAPAALTYIQEQLRFSLTSWGAALAASPQSRGELRFTARPFTTPYLDVARSAWRAVGNAENVLSIELQTAHYLAVGALTSTLAEGTPRRLLRELNEGSRAFVNQVRILPGRYTLTAKEQRIPITVVNEFPTPVTIGVTVRPHAPRITTDKTELVEVPAQGRTQILVPITSIATGLVAADAYIVTSSGNQYGEGQVLTFDIRTIGPVANWVLWGSTALLALAVALRLTRRIRSVRRSERANEQ